MSLHLAGGSSSQTAWQQKETTGEGLATIFDVLCVVCDKASTLHSSCTGLVVPLCSRCTAALALIVVLVQLTNKISAAAVSYRTQRRM
jgi:hypothetical protein